MLHRFDPMRILMQYASHKGLPYWGLRDKSQIAEGADFVYDKQNPDELTQKGTRLRYKDAMGRWVFMPVQLKHNLIGTSDNSYELPYALMKVSGKKTIVETPLVGRVGSVKELISIDDYSISITAILVGENGKYPESEIETMDKIWRLNEPIELISAFTDLILGNNDKIVIKSISYPSMQGIEDAQIVTIECITDRPFELYV